jgi:hypothetical protein
VVEEPAHAAASPAETALAVMMAMEAKRMTAVVAAVVVMVSSKHVI